MKNQKGFSLVELLVVVIIIAIIAAIAIPSLLASRRAANEASAINSLRTIHSAETTYLSLLGGGTNYANMTTLSGQGLLDPTFTGASMVKSGYTISVSTGTGIYCSQAVPLAGAGTRHFGADEVGVIYASVTAADIDCTSGDLTTTGTAAPIE